MAGMTSYGLRYRLTDSVSDDWGVYDRSVAGAHLANYGHIVVDEKYGTPIDNEHDLYVIEGNIRAALLVAGGMRI